MSGFWLECLIIFLLYGIPLASAVFFLVSFINYRSAKKCNRKKPGEIGEGWLRSLRRRVVISGAVAAVLDSVCLAYTLLFLFALVNM